MYILQFCSLNFLCEKDEKKREQCVFVRIHMSKVVCAENFLNIVEDFVVCLRLQSLYMCECVFGSVRRCAGHQFTCRVHTYSVPWRYAQQHTHLCATNINALPQVSVCVILRGITLWQDHTGDSFQLSKHHIKHTHTLSHTHLALDTVCLPPSLLRNWEKLLSIKTCWHHLDS